MNRHVTGVAVGILMMCSAAACGGSSAARRGALGAADGVPQVGVHNVHVVVDQYHLAPAGAHKRSLRKAILHYYASIDPSRLPEPSYEDVLEHFTKIASLLDPEDFVQGRVPSEFQGVAQYLLRDAGPRGDEARALSALWVLRALHPADGAYGAQYKAIADWVNNARLTSDPGAEEWNAVIDIYEDHARLTPAPAVLSKLTELYVRRAEFLAAVLGDDGEGTPPPGSFSFNEYVYAKRALQMAPIDVAAVYLRTPDFAAALKALRRMGGESEAARFLHVVLTSAQASTKDAPGRIDRKEALSNLAELYFRNPKWHPAVERLCFLGRREYPDDLGFARCLARMAATGRDPAAAVLRYSEAVKIAPETRAIYDEALEVLSSFISERLFASHPKATRGIAAKAIEILNERRRRWPDVPADVKPEALYLALGIDAVNHGDPEAGRRWFEQSIKETPSASAYLQLGLIHERAGRFTESIGAFKEAIRRLRTEDEEDRARLHAELLEHLADAYRHSRMEGEAKKTYQGALEAYEKSLPGLKGERLGAALVAKGIVLYRLGRTDEMHKAFEAAIRADPYVKETYARILSFLAVAKPDPEHAMFVMDEARHHMSLDPEWKVYFALWVKLIWARAKQKPPEEILEYLTVLADAVPWWSQLAKLGAGKISFDELWKRAGTLGEQTETLFYYGAERLGAGDLDQASKLFRRVLDSKMYNFYEYVIAQDLLLEVGSLPAAAAASVQPS